MKGEARDTFLQVEVGGGFRKGVAFVNGFNLGRYWPSLGPQMTLYVPASVLLSDAANELCMFELEAQPRTSERTVTLVDQPVLDAPVTTAIGDFSCFDQSK